MPAPSKGVPVTLDRVRHLRYPLGVLRGITVDTDLAEVLYLGLKHEDDELTAEQVGEMIDLEMMPSLADPLRKATGGLVNVRVMFSLNGDGPEDEAEGKAPTRAVDG